MPKMKTHSTCKKRFKKTTSGKIKRSKAFKRHHSWAKTPKQGRTLRKCTYVQKCDYSHILVLMPY
jgi:large subunit ribosomal protein L35